MTVCLVCGGECHPSACTASAEELRLQLMVVRQNARIVAAERDEADERADKLSVLVSATSPGALDVLEERARQERPWVEGRGECFTADHDESHDAGILAAAGACYAQKAFATSYKDRVPAGWPWDGEDWKPKDPRRDLVRAAALIIAEIDRLDRLSEDPGP